MKPLSVEIRTSLSHPLRINELSIEGVSGVIGITFCPGKRDLSSGGFRWERDLGIDLDEISKWRANAIVTLIEQHEFEMLGVPQLGEQIRALGIDWHHLPIVDVAPPDGRFERGWIQGGPQLCETLRGGGRVLVHCRGGLGRAGTVAARLLVDCGVSPSDAVARVRRARPGAIQTHEQQQYVLNLPSKRDF